MQDHADNRAAYAPEASGVKLDFARPRPARREEGGRRHRAILWGGLIAALFLMFAGTAVTMTAPREFRVWGMYLFLASALLYLICRCASIGLLNTMPKAFALVLMLAGCFILSRWAPDTIMGIVGIACLATALLLILLFGLGYVRQGRPPADRRRAS